MNPNLLDEEAQRIRMYALIIMSLLAVYLLMLQSCTISFQNISTHGVATDLVDENQKADADIRSNFEIPLTGI